MGRVFNSPEHKRSQAFIAVAARYAMKKDLLLEGPIEMRVWFYFEKPKSRKGNEKFVVTKPDSSNLIKNIEDACNGVVYKDDCQIVRIISEKCYGSKAFTWVEFEEI